MPETQHGLNITPSAPLTGIQVASQPAPVRRSNKSDASAFTPFAQSTTTTTTTMPPLPLHGKPAPSVVGQGVPYRLADAVPRIANQPLAECVIVVPQCPHCGESHVHRPNLLGHTVQCCTTHQNYTLVEAQSVKPVRTEPLATRPAGKRTLALEPTDAVLASPSKQLRSTGSADAQAAQAVHLDHLPDDCLQVMMSFLPETYLLGLRLVCKKLCRVVQESMVTLDLSRWDEMPAERLDAFQVVYKCVRRLVLADSNAGLTVLWKLLCNGVLYQLQCLDMSRCRDVGDTVLDLVAVRCGAIQELLLAHANRVTDAGIGNLTNGCRELRILNLAHCAQLTDASMQVIGARCVELQELYLDNCTHVTDIGVAAVSQGCQKLVVFHADAVARITDEGILNLTRNCPKLRVLHLSWCNLLTSNALIHIGRFAKNVRILCIPRCQSITDGGLQALAAGCKQLEELYIAWCDQITDEGVAALGAESKQLKVLDLSWCRSVTEAGMESVRAGCSQLRNLLPPRSW
eukprot:TRINITY_DN106_c0_g1_i2.p1 TRINITY_DN106_c0_g1~~TRINITY_DN106_c0_g1_i2.p1  ORF type:complete len:517 (-),score=97.70 TRINITY_DN106_c0_g1_i2:603-2153(-)